MEITKENMQNPRQGKGHGNLHGPTLAAGSKEKNHSKLLHKPRNLVPITCKQRRTRKPNGYQSRSKRTPHSPHGNILAFGTDIIDGIIGRWGALHERPDELYGCSIPPSYITILLADQRKSQLNPPPPSEPAAVEGIKVAIHPEYPEQIVTIGESLSEKGRMELCDLLKNNLDIFSCKPVDMTGVPRYIAEHRLNIRDGCPPIRQKRRGQAPDRNKAIQEEVAKLVEAQIMREVHYHSWLSNSVMMAEEDGEKTAFHTSQGVYCYTKMPFGLKNAGATYQRLVDKAFEK
ncbi:hypothetical protein Tco_0446057 [Tanacetum coccineum]